MTEPNKIKEAYNTINELIKENKWAEAHRACLEILRFDPENIKIIRLKNKIETKVKKLNKKAIKLDLNNLKPVWKTKDYKGILAKLKQLEPYIPDYPKIKNLIDEATTKYQQQLRSDQETGYSHENARIENLLKENKYEEALMAVDRLRIMGIHEKEIEKLLFRIRSNWIESEISKNKTLLSSHKYEDILLFYQQLLKIDPQSERLKKDIKQIKKEYKSYKFEEKKEFIDKSLEEIKTLYRLKKYEQAAKASSEILEFDPDNKTAHKFQKLCAQKIQKTIDDEVLNQMINNQKKLKEEYKTNKKKFVRIF